MEPRPGRLVKAVYDFPTDDDQELALLVGDIVQVKERIDKQWSRGFCAGREGNIPIGFTVEVKAPELSETQELFAATNDFEAQEDGDLTLKKGDLVVGLNPIDSNWWNGEIEGRRGIFPLTHVWRIDKSSLPVTSSNKKMFARAKVKMNMKAQLPEEMDLFKDEIVNIIEEVDKGWYRGECNGRQGVFSASFVTIVSDSEADSSSSFAEMDITTPFAAAASDKYGYDCVNSGINTAYGRVMYPFQAEYANELSLKEGEIVNLVRHVDDNWIEGEIDGKVGLFPANYVNIIVDCPKAEKEDEKDSSNESEANLFGSDTYGRVICDFDPQLEGGVCLREGDTVTLIRKVDRNWYEVITDNGDMCICPESYIEVIGSGPPSYSEIMSNSDQSASVNYIDAGLTSDFKFSSVTGRPLSFASSASDSSNSSHNSANERSFCKKSSDDKISESLVDFDSSLSANSSINKSFGLYDNFNENNSVQGNDLFSTSDSFSFSPIPIMSSTQIHEPRSNTKVPARPPPPSNVDQSRNTRLLNGSWNHDNSSRLSTISSSSQSSSNSFEGMSQSEIKHLIQQKEQTLKIRVSCKTKLENELRGSTNNSVSSEIKAQVSQLSEDIDRLKSEIASLKEKIRPELGRTVSDQSGTDDASVRDEVAARKKEEEQKRRDKERINKIKEQRECIITEMLQTERDYLSDLKLLHDTFLRNPDEAKSKGINVSTLFGNLDKVIDVAGRLLRRLQKQAQNNQLMGECFVDMSDEMKEVYGNYCRNHDEANSVLDKIEFQASAGQFIYEKLEILKRQTNCFDLGAMLIKPVQRILKYPLLLNELLKCTADGHPDKPGLIQAISLMTDVATAINECKRKKDLVSKYRKQSDVSLSERISKINLHSMAKKSSRFGMRISSSIGLKTVTKDQEFEKVVRKFNALEKSLKIFLKDLSEYTKKAEELFTLAFNISEDIAELYQERKSQQEVDQFRSVHRMILTQFWEAFKQAIDRNVQFPIRQLLQAYRGPVNLIQKRNDKLLDYVSSTNKLEKNKDVTKIKMLQEAQMLDKHNYEALNSQLLDDLPKLCDLSIEILCDCIKYFLKAKKNFVGKTAMHMMDLMDLPLMLSNKGSDILETFQVKHNLVMDDLGQLSIAKHFQPCIKTDTLKRNSSLRGSKLKPQTASVAPIVKVQNATQKNKIKTSYSEAVLYTACQDFHAVDYMDISLKKGDVVGVIKQQNPMGNKTKWFVDNGVATGFVPAKCLVKYIPNPNSLNSSSDWSRTSFSSTTSSDSSADALYSRPNKSKPNLKPTNAIQPTRPAPPVTSSLRMVAPSRYPPTPQSSNNSSQRIGNIDGSINPSERNSAINASPILPQRSITPTPNQRSTNSLFPIPGQQNSANVSPTSWNTATNIPPTSTQLNTSINAQLNSASTNSNTNASSNSNIQRTNISPSISPYPTIRRTASPNLNSNTNAASLEPEHRYEEVPEIQSNSLRLLGDISITTNQSGSNILDEFDPYSTTKVEMYDNVPENMNSVYSSHRYEDIPDDSYYDEVPTDVQQGEVSEYYYALYDFSPNGENQLSLRKGQVVVVLHKCDLNKNSEWWFVEDRHSNRGYVPGAYLNKYVKDA